MASLDGSIAAKRNRADKSQLASELHRITKEERNEIRMHNNETQRFKTKYSKLELYQDIASRGSNSSSVRLYETHTPGFMYRRNGECRLSPPPSPYPSANYQDIHNLLFTNGEVDIEKVLCLHLLSTHRTESLSTPTTSESQRGTSASREPSPLERLIERSKKRYATGLISKLLPTYVIDINDTKDSEHTDNKENNGNKTGRSKKCLASDGRLVARLLINDKIMSLIDSVLVALQNSNLEKMEELITLAGDPDALRKILQKPEMQNFMCDLNTQALISSCESFHLTAPFKKRSIPLEVRTTSGGLEKLIDQIRKNVLKTPAESTWRNMYERSLGSFDATRNSTDTEMITKTITADEPKTNDDSPMDNTQTTLTLLAEGGGGNRTTRTNFINKNILAVANLSVSRKTSVDNMSGHTPRNSRRSSSASGTNSAKGRRKSSDSHRESDEIEQELAIFKDQERALLQQEYGFELDDEEEELKAAKEREEMRKMEQLRKKNLNYQKLAVMLAKKIAAANKKDRENLKAQLMVEKSRESEDSTDSSRRNPAEEKTKHTHTHDAQAKYSLKQTICVACLEKWKKPLPPPKMPRLKKFCVPVLDQNAYNEVKTSSTHRISIIIDEEMQKVVNSMPKRRSRNSESQRVKFDQRGEPSLWNMAVDSGNVLRDVDLAKIRQEIRERETKKKLEGFLKSEI